MDKVPVAPQPGGMNPWSSLVSRAPWALWLSRLKHPTLFKLALGLALASWVLPDPLPVLDEALFTALALAVASWKNHRAARPETVAVHRVDTAPSR